MRVLLSAVCMLAFAGFGYADDKKEEPKLSPLKEKSLEISREMQREMAQARSKAGEKMLALAKEYPADPGAFDATLQALGMGARGAGAFLSTTFADDPKILKAIPQLAQGADGDKILASLVEQTKSKDIKGAAKFAAVSAEIESADYPRTGKPLPTGETAAKFAAAGEKLADIVKEFGDVKTAVAGTAEAPTVAEASKKLKFFVENLTVGKVAPDFESPLLEAGKKAKLSDYRGNVVVLDVWATWCGPCRAMIPHEREMVKKFSDKKFKLISVSADEKKETLTKFLEKEEMPWTHFWVGTKGFVEEYQVRFYPTMYILDAKGVIRGKHLRGDDLEHFVEKLLAESDPK